MNQVNGDFSPLANFIIGGLAGTTSSTILYPIDFIKTRMSIKGSDGSDRYKSMYDCCKKVTRKEGILALYKGISAAWLRQATYSSTRIGIFITTEDLFIKNYDETPNYLYHLWSAIIAGVGGALAGTPSDVILTRISIDGRLHKCERRNYKNVYDAFMKITKKEGYLTLWRGGSLAVIRATATSITQLATYESIKELLSTKYNLNENYLLNFYASMFSGLLTSIITTPLDIIKIRLQGMKKIKGIPEYTGAFDVLMKILKNEGFKTFTRGFLPDYLKMGPHTVILLMTMDQYGEIYKFFKYHQWELND